MPSSLSSWKFQSRMKLRVDDWRKKIKNLQNQFHMSDLTTWRRKIWYDFSFSNRWSFYGEIFWYLTRRFCWIFPVIIISIDQLCWFFRRGFQFVYDIFVFMVVMDLILNLFRLLFHWCHWFFRQIIRCCTVIFDDPSRWSWLMRLAYHLCWRGFRHLKIQTI